MKQINLSEMSVDGLVSQFAAMAREQDDAMLDDDNEKFNRLFLRMEAIEAELKARGGDQRRALIALYDDPNLQVRLAAAQATLAIAPDVARAALQAIADSDWQPQAADARMSLRNLNAGIFKPT